MAHVVLPQQDDIRLAEPGMLGPRGDMRPAEPGVLHPCRDIRAGVIEVLLPRRAVSLRPATVTPSLVERTGVTRDLSRGVAPIVISDDFAADGNGVDCRIVPVDGLHPGTAGDALPGLGFRLPGTLDVTEMLAEQVSVSGNLLTPIGKPDRRGKNYVVATGQTGSLPALTRSRKQSPARRREESEQRRSPATVVSKGLSIWDMILPLLKPPLDFDFPMQLDLPSDLYPFQVEGVRRLVESESFLLGDEMGTGKTVMATVALRMLFHKGRVTRALVLAPANVVSVWDEHLRDWGSTALSLCIVHGMPQEQRKNAWRQEAHVYVTSYSTFRNDVRHGVLKPVSIASFDAVILDEVHHIRNSDTQTAWSIRKLAPTYRWGLSGTPLQNRLADLAGVFRFVSPDLQLAGVSSAARVQELIRPYFLRRRKRDVLKDLPEKVSQDIWLQLDADQRRAYEAALSRGKQRFEEGRESFTKMHVFALLVKLKQICNFAPQKDNSPKVELLMEQLSEALDGEHKAVVFSQYVGEGTEKLRGHLERYGLAEMRGGMSPAQKQRSIKAFQNDIETQVFLGTTHAAGEGITLTEGNYVFHFDHWWNPATTRQAEDRVHREGQTKQVNVYHYWTENTIEERIYDLLARKGLLYDEVVDSLSEEDIEKSVTIEDWCSILGLEVHVARGSPPTKNDERRPVEGSTGSAGDAELTLGSVYNRLSEVSPSEFEHLVAAVLSQSGFANVRVTGRSPDGGVDMEALQNGVGGQRLVVVQCKQRGQVDVEVARELLGTVRADPRISEGYLVVSGKLTRACLEFIRRDGSLASIDGVGLASRIIQLGLDLRGGKAAGPS